MNLAICFLLAANSGDRYLHVQTTTDTMQVVTNNKVMIKQGGPSRCFVSDSVGWTHAISLGSTSPVEITLKEKSTPYGLALGQRRLFSPHAAGAGQESHDLLMLAQPVLEPIVLDSAALHMGQSTSHSRWRIYPGSPEATYLLAVDVGMLLTEREITAFAAYYGITLPLEYSLGVVIKATDPEPLGEGFNLEINCAGHGFLEAPGVDTFLVASNSQDLGTASLAVSALGWSLNLPEAATYSVNGQLGKGLNLLLFTGDGGGASDEMVATTPSFPPLAQGYPPVDCTPEIPIAPGDMGCTPTPPQGTTPDCPPGTCGPTLCGPAILHKIATRCGGSGDSFNFTVTTTVSKSLSVSFKMNAPFLEVGASGTGSAEGSESESGTMGFGDGSGCGQCKTLYAYSMLCSAVCTLHERMGAFGPFDFLPLASCKDVTELVACMDIYKGITPPCNRNCQ